MIRGTFHFHSTYSHDGRNTLPEIASSLSASGFSFCVMTEHFEDFCEEKFCRYLQELRDVTRSTGFIFVPGIEVNVTGLDTILFPVSEYSEIVRFAAGAPGSTKAMCKVLAHPSKYAFEKVVAHIEKYGIDGIELWNQQADGRHMPPKEFLKRLKELPWRNRHRYFFGCDLHSANLVASNVLAIAGTCNRTPEDIARVLVEGDFLASNDPTGISYQNGAKRTDFDEWFAALQSKPNLKGRVLASVRSCLKPMYRMLPRAMRHSLNDVKNFVKDKV